MRRIPQPGTRVIFTPNPASYRLYSNPPKKGAQGAVTTVPLGVRRAHYLRGPGGGLVYVNWDNHPVQGVSLHDLSYALAPGLGGNNKAPYRWKITKDHICDGDDAGVEGPHNLDPEIKHNRAHFVMKDDDGETYYEGEIYGDYDGFEPLDDFGTPNAGATRIFYKGKEL